MNTDWEVCRKLEKYTCSPLYRKSCGHTVIWERRVGLAEHREDVCPVCGGAMVYEGGPVHPPGTILIWDERPA